MSYDFFFNDTATSEIYTLSLHDALPIASISAIVSLRLSLGMKRLPSRTRQQIGSGGMRWRGQPLDRKGEVVSINTVWMGTPERLETRAAPPFSRLIGARVVRVPSGKSRSWLPALRFSTACAAAPIKSSLRM